MSLRTAASACSLLVVSGVLVSGGCLPNYWTPGGPMGSDDRYTYESTEWLPQTVTVVDTVTQQVIWSKEVPVGKKLIMRFTEPEDLYRDSRSADPELPVKLQWDIIPAEEEWATPKQTSWVVKSRRVDVKLRPVPEQRDPEPPAGTPTSAKPAVGG
ncbi:MAG: hypothetical protein AB7K52_08835 [Phycisphaerales bacterium]